jgi:hypothetical protein
MEESFSCSLHDPSTGKRLCDVQVTPRQNKVWEASIVYISLGTKKDGTIKFKTDYPVPQIALLKSTLKSFDSKIVFVSEGFHAPVTINGHTWAPVPRMTLIELTNFEYLKYTTENELPFAQLDYEEQPHAD